MTLKPIGVDGLTIDHVVGSPVSGGTFTITSTPSLKVKAEGKGVYSGTLNFTFAGGNGPGAVDGTVTATGSINPTAVYVKADGSLVIREDDVGNMTGTGTNSNPPPPTVPIFGVVEITNAGQTKVKAQ